MHDLEFVDSQLTTPAHTLLDEFLPVYDVSDAVATVVAADLATTWDALMQVDLIDVGRQRPLVGMLGALRALPAMASQLLHGEIPAEGSGADAPARHHPESGP